MCIVNGRKPRELNWKSLSHIMYHERKQCSINHQRRVYQRASQFKIDTRELVIGATFYWNAPLIWPILEPIILICSETKCAVRAIFSGAMRIICVLLCHSPSETKNRALQLKVIFLLSCKVFVHIWQLKLFDLYTIQAA